MTTQMPFSPDYYETFLTICEVLLKAYNHILQINNDTDNINLLAMTRIDEIIRTDIISPVIQHIDILSKSIVYEETTKLDSHLIHS